MEKDTATSANLPSPGKALILLLGAMLFTVGYLGIGKLLGIVPFYAGFLFMLYWVAIMGADRAAFLPSLVGALAAIGISFLFHFLPPIYGPACYPLLAILILVPIYLSILQRAKILVNNSLWLFLTVGTAPPIASSQNFAAMAAAVAFSAAYAFVLLYVAHRVATRSSTGSVVADRSLT